MYEPSGLKSNKFPVPSHDPSKCHGVTGNAIPVVKEGSLQAKVHGRSHGVPIVTQIRKSSRTVCGLRDKMACASSSAKTSRFVNINGRLDNSIDRPEQSFTARPMFVRGLGSGVGGRLRRSVNV
jgi:hypothetical protein